MNFFRDASIDWKYILIITIFGLIVGASLTWYQLWQNNKLGTEAQISKPPERVADFSLTVNYLTKKMAIGGVATYDIQITFLNNFNTIDTDLWLTGIPAGITARYTPDPLPHSRRCISRCSREWPK